LKKKLLVLYLVLLVTGAVLAVALSSTSRNGASSTGAKRSRAAKERRKRPPKLRLAGHVLEADGKPVKGAMVYVLSKKKRGGERDELVHEVTDAEGRWAFETRTIVGRWIGVVAPGYRNATLDGDGVNPEFQITLVVKRAPPLQVKLSDEAGKPVAGQGIQLEPWPPGIFHFLPGPESRQGEQWAVTNAEGMATFRLGAPGPVSISPQIEGHHTAPASTWLADGRGRIELQVHPSTTLDLRLRSAADGAKIHGVVTVELYDPETGRSLTAYTDATDLPGALRIERVLSPGTYDAHVTCAGHATAIVQDFVVPAHPEIATLAVRPVKLRPKGRLRVRLEGVGGTETSRGRRRAPISFLLRDEPGWRRLGWQAGAPEEWNRSERRLDFELPAGRYNLLIADVLTGRAAIVQGLVIESGGELDRKLRLSKGIRPTLPTLCAEGEHPRSLSIRSAEWPRLPVYGSTPNARARMGDVLAVISCQHGGESVRLGPYPVPEITLEVLDWSDAVKTHALK